MCMTRNLAACDPKEKDATLATAASLTLHDYFERTCVGGSEERLNRLCAIVIDGRPLRAYSSSSLFRVERLVVWSLVNKV